jgi:hypothetical protein
MNDLCTGYAIEMSTSRARLEPGQTSIDRVPVRGYGDGYALDWSVKLLDGQTLRKRSRGRTKALARTNARRMAAELLTTGPGAAWKTTDAASGFIEQVSRPMIEDSARLRDSTRARYLQTLGLLVGTCEEHKHPEALGPKPIAALGRYQVLVDCLQAISRTHGAGTGRHARAVLSKYVCRPMVREGLLSSYVLAGEQLDLDRTLTDAKSSRGGVAIAEADHERMLAGLLGMDPAEGVTASKRGPGRLEVRIAQRQNVRIATLMQMTMGLRLGEVRTLTWDRVRKVDGALSAIVTDGVSKTRKGRVVPFLDDRVAEVVQAQRKAVGGVGYVIGTPSDRSRAWDKDNAQQAIRRAYVEWADEYEIPALTTSRTHVWRATLNTMYLDLPEVVRIAYFGHTAAVSREHYTDLGQAAGMLIEARRRREGTH